MRNNVKITTLPGLFDLIAPHSCRGCGHVGSILCDCCKNDILSHHIHVCPKCKKPLATPNCPDCTFLPPTYAVGPRSGLLDDLVHTYKYDSIRALAPILAELLDYALPHSLPSDAIIIPLPTSTKHIRERGFDHTRLIAKHLARRRGWRVSPLLTRAKNTVQVGADRASRLSQASSAYALCETIPVSEEATYLLLDDVCTTGASMQAAISLLRSAGASSLVLALLAYGENT